MQQLRCFFFERTEHFVHELAAFARTRLDMAAFDKHARYPGRVEAALPRRVSHPVLPGVAIVSGSSDRASNSSMIVCVYHASCQHRL